jgi:hypothetical protein
MLTQMLRYKPILLIVPADNTLVLLLMDRKSVQPVARA